MPRKRAASSSKSTRPATKKKEDESNFSNIVFRQMELKDCAASFHLGEMVFTAELLPSLYRTFDQYEVIEKLSGDSELCMVAESNSKIVGFVLGAVITKKRLEKHGYIEWVAIHPDYQRLGVGTKLVSLLADKMLDEYGVGTLSADTSADNTPARNFLSKLGFCNQKAHVYMSCTTNHDTQVANRHNEDGGKSLIGAHDGSGVMIRPMGLDDLNAVFLLGERMFTKERFPNLYLGWDEYEVMDMFDTDSQSCLVAEYKDEMVGFVLGNTIEKSRATFTYGYLRWLGVSPDVQRLGVGRKLFAAFEELMNEENVHMLIIDTQADNLPAIRFFENMGFGSQSDHFYYSRPAARLGV